MRYCGIYSFRIVCMACLLFLARIRLSHEFHAWHVVRQLLHALLKYCVCSSFLSNIKGHNLCFQVLDTKVLLYCLCSRCLAVGFCHTIELLELVCLCSKRSDRILSIEDFLCLYLVLLCFHILGIRRVRR